jgi:N-acetylglucosaminyl-diphospho-decaprenol L-rhamnosyltransferase
MGIESSVGVVIATRDRRDTVLATLARVVALPERPPVLVVDDASCDGTAHAIAERFPQVDVVRLPRARGAAARNVGVERLATPYVAFLDDDSWWAPGSLARAVSALDAQPQLAVVAAQVLVGEEERLDPACVTMRRSPLGDEILGFVACAAVVRRSAFLAAGGFHPRYGIGGEEARLAVALAAAGWQLRYLPEVVAHHHPMGSGPRPGRVAQILRNDLWTVWSARPPAAAARASARLIRRGGLCRETATGVLRALGGATWIARERRPVPPALEAKLRLLDAA